MEMTYEYDICSVILLTEPGRLQKIYAVFQFRGVHIFFDSACKFIH
jgi:nitrate reductase NapAB chaperone NapD